MTPLPLRRGGLLGLVLGGLLWAAEVLARHDALQPLGAALREAGSWFGAYLAAGLCVGLLAALLWPLAPPTARRRGPHLLLGGLAAALSFLAAALLPLATPAAPPTPASLVLLLGAAAGVALLAVAVAASPLAWAFDALLAPPTLVGAAAVAVLALGPLAWSPPSTEPPPVTAPPPGGVAEPPRDLLFVVERGVRADHLGAFGHFRATSPHLDALAESGWAAPLAFSAAPGSSASALRALLSAALPSQPGTPLAASLRAAGFQCIALHAGDDDLALDQLGFDRVVDVLVPPLPARLWLARLTLAPPMRPSPPHAPALVDAALARLLAAGAPERRLFLLVVLPDAVGPAPVPPEVAELFLPAGGTAGSEADLTLRYDAALRAQDEELGRLVATLLEAGRLEETLLVVVAERGRFLGEAVPGPTAPPALDFHDALLRVPLVVRHPRTVPAGRRALGPTSTIDLAPALLAALGLAAPLAPTDSSASPHPLDLHGDSAHPPRDAVIAETDRFRAERTESWFLLRTADRKVVLGPGGELVAYGDLRHDPGESFLTATEIPREALGSALALAERLRAALGARKLAAKNGSDSDGRM